MEVKNRLKEFRHDNRMNQKQFAEFLGVAPEQISRWERQKEQPGIVNIFKICRKLDIKVEDLFEIIEDS